MTRQWRAISGSAKVWILIGIAVCLIGVILCSRAGYLREKDKDAGQSTAARSVRAFAIGIVLCIVSGVMSACASIGFDYGQPIKVAGNAVGFMTGEWRGATARSKGFLYAGIAVLIVATACLAFASSLGTG